MGLLPPFPSNARLRGATVHVRGERFVPVQSLPEDDFDENPGMPVKYDRIGDTYDRTRRSDPRIADRLVSLLESVPGAAVLDIGCGTGNYTSALAKRGLRMVGLDLSRTMLAMARAKHPRLPLVCADGAALPFAGGAFAHAVTTLAIHHMADLDGGLLERPTGGGQGRPLCHLLRTSRAARGVLARALLPVDDGGGSARVPIPKCGGRGPVRRGLPVGRPRTLGRAVRSSPTCSSTQARTAPNSTLRRDSAAAFRRSGNSQARKWMTVSRGSARTSIPADGRRSGPAPITAEVTTASSSPIDPPSGEAQRIP